MGDPRVIHSPQQEQLLSERETATTIQEAHTTTANVDLVRFFPFPLKRFRVNSSHTTVETKREKVPSYDDGTHQNHQARINLERLVLGGVTVDCVVRAKVVPVYILEVVAREGL